jgi:hypothetical protein
MDAGTSPLRVVIGCDVDPDRLDFGGIPFNAGTGAQRWRGVDCIEGLRERLDAVRDANDRPVAVTWHLRCDAQVRATEGAYETLIETRRALWQRCERSGDEIGWHPHFWRLAEDGATWFQEMDDREFQRTMLREAHAAFTRAWGRPPASVRMGWDYHNNDTMAELANLGVRIDLSALPYQWFAGSRNDRGASFAGYFDWSTSGTAPYRPSRRDYRVPGKGPDSLPILELPQGLLRSRLAGFLAEARGALRERSIDRLVRAATGRAEASNSTIKACAPTALFRAMVKDILRRGEDWVVTYFHPDELLPRKGKLVNDLIHRASYFLANVGVVLDLAGSVGRRVEFVTAAEAASILNARGVGDLSA